METILQCLTWYSASCSFCVRDSKSAVHISLSRSIFQVSFLAWPLVIS